MITTHLVVLSFFDGASFGGVVPEPEVSAPIPAGRSKRRRYIMPDGELVQASTEEAYAMLERYTSPAEQKPQRKTGESRIVMPRIEFGKRDVRFIPATDSQPDTWKVVLSDRFIYRPDPVANLLAVEKLNRIKDDEEAIMVLLH